MKAVLAIMVAVGAVGCGDDPEPHEEQILDPARSGFSIDRTSAIVHEVVTATVILRDTNGEPLPGLEVTLVTTGMSNTVTQPPLTDSAGEASGTWTTTRAEVKSITAMLPDGTSIGPRSVTFLAAAPSKLVFKTQPYDVEAGEPMGVEVELEDEDGNLASSIMPVALRLGANPSSTELEGTLEAAPAFGVASFSGLHVDVADTSYSLIASAMGLPDVESESFDVISGAPIQAKSSLTASPHSNDADGISTAQIAIAARNQYDVPISGLGVTIDVTGSGNTLGAMTIATASDGTSDTTLKSTTAESKVVSANFGPFTLSAPVEFFAPACTVLLPNRPSTVFASTARAMVTADFDGDGNVDVADAEQITQNPPHQSQIVIRRGRGDGRFLPGVVIPIAGAASSMSTADVDGDGDLDLVATVSDQSVAYVLLQSSSATFGAPVVTTLDGAANALALADLDEDGDIDLIASLVDIDRVAIHLGTGTGGFGAGSLLTVGPYPVSVTAADFNRDGHLDVGVSQFNEGSYSTFLGNGDGTFGVRRTKGATSAGSQSVADVDHDSILDVVVTSMQNDGLDVLLGNGDGTFRHEWGLSPGVIAPSTALADLNGDTHPDLVLASSPTLLVLLGTGTGEFSPTHRYAQGSFGATLPTGLRGGIALADVDHDGILDAVTAGRGLDVIAGAGNGAFVAAPLEGERLGFIHPVDTDFNGDGRLDLAAFGDQQEYLLFDQASGALSAGPPFAAGGQSTLLVAGDVNEDGHEDVVLCGTLEFGMQFALRVGLGTGTGTFSFGPNIPNNVIGEQVLLANIDGDTHLDLLLLHGGDFTRGLNFSIGNGAGSFGAFNSTVPRISTTSDPRDVDLADLDQDGDLDLVVAQRRELAIYRNDGTGNFIASTYAIPDLDFLDRLNAVTVGDFDGDTWLDVAVGHYLGRIHVFRGVTGGALDPTPERYELHTSDYFTSIDAMEARDFDGDGTLDLFAVGTEVWLLQGFGNGDFRTPRLYNLPVSSGLSGRSEYVLGDRNADARVDLAVSPRGIAVALQGPCMPFVP